MMAELVSSLSGDYIYAAPGLSLSFASFALSVPTYHRYNGHI